MSGSTLERTPVRDHSQVLRQIKQVQAATQVAVMLFLRQSLRRSQSPIIAVKFQLFVLSVGRTPPSRSGPYGES